MGALTNFLETQLLDHVLRNVAYVAPATVYVALFTTPTTDAGGGTEVVGGAYARTAVTFAAAVAGLISNNALVSFPIATAPWGTITHAAIFDAAVAGNMLWHGAIPNTVIGIAQTFTIPIGALTAELD